MAPQIDDPYAVTLIPDAEETVQAIHRGMIDAVVVQEHGRFQVVTLTGAEEPYRVLVDRMSEGALTLSETGTVMFVNSRLTELAGCSADEIVGQPFAALFAGDVAAQYHPWVQPPAEGIRQELELVRPHDRLPVSVWAGPITIGKVRAALVTITDLTVQRRAEEIAVAERFSRSILEQVTDPIVVLDKGGRIIRASAAAEQLSGGSPLGHRFSEIFQLQPANSHQESLMPDFSPNDFDTLLPTRAFHGLEVRLSGSAAASRTFLLSAGPLLDDSQHSVGSIVTLTDITARKHAEEQQIMLVAELNHRVKNILAVVQSIAHQTARGSTSLATFHKAFGARLGALAIAHDVLTKTRWRGVELTELLRESLAPYPDRVRMKGQATMVPSQTVVPLSMILNELMTNAAKYGALSTSGHVEIEWLIGDQGRSVRLSWLERNGPPVNKPKRTGFGSTVIEWVARSDLNGKCTLDFQSGGLECTLCFPIQRERTEQEPFSVNSGGLSKAL
jgi:PAS domain S-box-containing protein